MDCWTSRREPRKSAIRRQILLSWLRHQKDLGDINEFLKHFKIVKNRIYQQIMIPSFRDAMKKDLEEALKYYKAILETEDASITDSFFGFTGKYY